MYKLRDYQQEAVNNVIKYFQKKRDPAMIVLPTGAGKSLVIAELARIARGRVLVLAHVKELVEQNYEKYKSYGLAAGIFSASLGKKEWDQKAIFGSVQSVARAPDDFFNDFSLLVIDECHSCGCENDITSRECEKCRAILIDADAKLKQAKLSKNAHILTPDKITFDERLDKNSNPYLEIRYYDCDAQYLSEAHFFSNPTSIKKFNINFLRSHLKRPELAFTIKNPQDVIKIQKFFRLPSFVIARKQDKFWKITEKVFAEEL